MLGGWSLPTMNLLVKFIPYIEALFILTMLGLGYLGYLSLSGKTSQRNQNRAKLKWILSGLMGLAILSITLLIWVSFSQE